MTRVDALFSIDMSFSTHSYSIWGTSTPNGGLILLLYTLYTVEVSGFGKYLTVSANICMTVKYLSNICSHDRVDVKYLQTFDSHDADSKLTFANELVCSLWVCGQNSNSALTVKYLNDRTAQLSNICQIFDSWQIFDRTPLSCHVTVSCLME